MKIRIITLSLGISLLTGCQAIKQPITLVPVNQPELDAQEESFEQDDFPVADEGSFVYDNSPEIKAALKKFATSGKAPIVKHAGFVQFPFGEVQPILNCQPNYGCDIELQAGETVKAVILGNEPLWDYLVWESNQQFEPVPHVTIGPRVSQAKTNAIIGTNRRTYHLELLSTTSSDYTRSAKFYYPRERLREYQAKMRNQKRAENRRSAQERRDKALGESLEGKSLPYQFMSFGWEVEAKESISWKPHRVFDDGAHIYLQFPEHIVFEDLPGVYTSAAGGKLTQPVWRTVTPAEGPSREKGTYIMVDGMFDELRLVGGFSGKQETVIIRKKH